MQVLRNSAIRIIYNSRLLILIIIYELHLRSFNNREQQEEGERTYVLESSVD